MYTGSGAGPVDIHRASTRIIDLPHSATGEGYDQSEELISRRSDDQLRRTGNCP